MQFISDLLSNKILVAAFFGWLTAQVLKTIIYILVNKEFNPERLLGDGGMPSSHSATVMALVTATCFYYGPSSFEVAIAGVLALITMHDAMGVRQETGKQAKVINSMVELINSFGRGELTPEETLKEFVGHTRRQVVIGAAVGCVVALVMNGIV